MIELFQPTIVEAVIFDAESAAAKLRKAMKGLGSYIHVHQSKKFFKSYRNVFIMYRMKYEL